MCDSKLRELERAAATSGAPEDLVAWYRAAVRAGVEFRAEGEEPETVLEVGKLGRVRLLLNSGERLRLLPIDGEPLTVNRVEYRLSGAYWLTPGGTWTQRYSDHYEHVRRERGQGAAERMAADVAHGYCNYVDMSRADGQWRKEPSDAALKKAREALHVAVLAWVEGNAEALRRARVQWAAECHTRALHEVERLRAELDQAEAEAAAHALIVARGGE